MKTLWSFKARKFILITFFHFRKLCFFLCNDYCTFFFQLFINCSFSRTISFNFFITIIFRELFLCFLVFGITVILLFFDNSFSGTICLAFQ